MSYPQLGSFNHTKGSPIRRAFGLWSASNCTSIFEAYVRPSQVKVWTFDQWLSWFPCSDCRIISHNTFSYSLGVVTSRFGKKAFVWITRDHLRWCYLSEIIESYEW